VRITMTFPAATSAIQPDTNSGGGRRRRRRRRIRRRRFRRRGANT
jgi:hypothetical protein